MNIRDFDGSKADFLELSKMYTDLKNYSEDSFLTYSHGIDELMQQLKVNRSKCFIVEKSSKIAGFAIIIPDYKGGAVGQCLYLKNEYRKGTLFPRLLEQLEEYIDSNYEYCILMATNEKVASLYDKKYQKRVTFYKYNSKKGK